MASNALFIIMTIIAAILLLVSGISAAIAASDAFSSSFYSNSKIRSAHQYLTISAALGISAVATLILILVVAAISGQFTSTEFSQAFFSKTSPTKEDIIAAYKAEKSLSAEHTTQIIVLVVLIIVAIIALVVGILSAIGAIQLGSSSQQDNKSRSAYTAAIVSAITGIGGIIMMIIAVVVYFTIRNSRLKTEKDLQAYTDKLSPPKN